MDGCYKYWHVFRLHIFDNHFFLHYAISPFNLLRLLLQPALVSLFYSTPPCGFIADSLFCFVFQSCLNHEFLRSGDSTSIPSSNTRVYVSKRKKKQSIFCCCTIRDDHNKRKSRMNSTAVYNCIIRQRFSIVTTVFVAISWVPCNPYVIV